MLIPDGRPIDIRGYFFNLDGIRSVWRQNKLPSILRWTLGRHNGNFLSGTIRGPYRW